MRSVVLGRRSGRPLWQLTTRPSTAVVIALVSLAAAGVQVALFSSPTPWYQVAVVAFWVVVALAFVASAVGTRARARRQAAAAANRPPVDAVPFVPVPVRPARPRRRDADAAVTDVAEVGEPTDPVAAPRTTALRAGPRPAPPWRPSQEAEARTSTVAVTSRHAVRAVALAESAYRELPVPAPAVAEGRGTSRRALTAETVALRDGRVHPRPSPTARVTSERAGSERAGPERAPAARSTSAQAGAPATIPRPAGVGRRRITDESRATTPPRRGGAAPTGAVPSPRQAPSEERPRPTPAKASAPAPGEPGSGTVRRSTHARRTGRAARDGRSAPTPAPAPEAAPTRRRDEPARPAVATRRRDESVSTQSPATTPFGGGMTFGDRVVPSEPASESWAPAQRGPVPGPATGRHASLTASPAGGVPRGATARHAVAAESGRRRAS